MNNDQMNLLRAALERAAATMRGPTPNDQVAARFGGMQPSAMTPNDQVGFRFPEPSPNQQVANRFPGPSANEYVASNFPPAMAQGAPVPQPQAAPTPTPQPRPASAPQEMGFFQRNAAMMTDPVTGMFIDPEGAARAQASPNTINKMLGHLFNKAS